MATNNSDSSDLEKFPDPEELESVPGGYDPTPLFRTKPLDDSNRFSTLKDAVESVFNTLGMNVKSVLDTKHIIALARGRIFAERYNSKLMTQLCQELLEMRVSLKGRGRKDLVATLQASMLQEKASDDEKSKADRLFGRSNT